VLIANRGEIAVRVITALRELSITSVAVFSEDDADSVHTKLADEAYSIGAGTVAETYLDAEKLIEVAKQCGADAVHPGYGFLSENPSFVDACEAAGLVF